MEKRSCPNCNASLGDHDGYYCSSCGHKLPKDLVRSSKAVRIRTYSPSEPEVAKGPAAAKLLRKLKDKTFWMIFGLVLVIFVSLMGIGSSGAIELALLQLNPGFGSLDLNLPTRRVEPTAANLNLALPITEAEFGEFGLVKHVPAEVDFYFEGANLIELLEQPLFAQEDNDFTPKARILLNNSFAGFSYGKEGENRWGFLFVPKDLQIAQEVFGNGWDSYWKIAFINDYMLLANNEDVFDLVKSVDGGLNLSLAQNPEYVKRAKALDTSGQLRVLFMTEKASGIVRNSLAGFTQDTIGMINKVLTNGSDSLVVTKNGEN